MRAKWRVLFLLLFTIGVTAEEIGPAQRLDYLEQVVMGKIVENGIIERLSLLEQEVFGQTYQDLIPIRLSRLDRTLIYNGEYGQSLVFKISAGEWFITKHCYQGCLLDRTAFLEKILYGFVTKGCLLERVQKLIASCWSNGQLVSEKVLLPVNTLIKVKLLTELHTSKSRAGDKFQYEITENIYLDSSRSILVIPAGNIGAGNVVGVTKPGKFGRDGKLQLDPGQLTVFDGSRIQVYVDDQAMRKNKSEKLAVGIAAAGIFIAGPAGIVTPLLVDGKDTVLSVGAEFYIQTKQAVQVEALRINM
ncbi:MAG: hypothetical protein ACM3WV_09110 [Bacillota bacterium]